MVFFSTSPTLTYMAIHSHLAPFRPKRKKEDEVKLVVRDRHWFPLRGDFMHIGRVCIGHGSGGKKELELELILVLVLEIFEFGFS